MMAEPQRTIVNFKESCVDPLAKMVLLEAMSFAVEKAESRLESLGKIFPGLEALGIPIIQDIKDIRFSVENLNVCLKPDSTVLGSAPLPPSAPLPTAVLKTFDKREQELIKQMPESLQKALAMDMQRAETGTPVKEPDFWVKGEGITATKKKKEKEPEPPPKKVRTVSEQWGPLEFKDISYTSPGAFLDALHEKTGASRGATSQIKQLDKDGFDVYIAGKLVSPNTPQEELALLKGVGMRIELKKGVIQPIPSGGKPIPQPTTNYPAPWVQVVSEEGQTLYFEDAKGRVIPPGTWQPLSETELDKLATNTRKGGVPALGRGIPGLPVRGGRTAKAPGSK
jgi:hypothetical protein